MVEIEAFRGFRYDTEKVAIKKVVSPPYDVINRQQRKGYISNSPYNIVKIILPEKKDGSRDYKLAKETLTEWIDEEVLKQDELPAIYIYEQRYKIKGQLSSRYGFLSLIKLQDTKENVLPHEKIFSRPFKDRVNLMKETRAHLSPIFIIYNDFDARGLRLLKKAVNNQTPDADIVFEGVRHRFWHIAEKGFISELRGILAGAKTFIADGHHRFAASVAVKDYFDKKKISSDGHNYTLAYFVSSEDKGLTILPTHRGVKILPKGFSKEYLYKRLSGYFKIRELSPKDIDKELARAFKNHICAFVIFYANRYIFISLKNKHIVEKIGPAHSSHAWRSLDVSILHNLIFSKLLGIKENIAQQGNIFYYKDKDELIKKVKSGEYLLGVFLNPTRIEQVEEIALASEKMPHKSTYFFPKPLTGLILHKF